MLAPERFATSAAEYARETGCDWEPVPGDGPLMGRVKAHGKAVSVIFDREEHGIADVEEVARIRLGIAVIMLRNGCGYACHDV